MAVQPRRHIERNGLSGLEVDHGAVSEWRVQVGVDSLLRKSRIPVTLVVVVIAPADHNAHPDVRRVLVEHDIADTFVVQHRDTKLEPTRLAFTVPKTLPRILRKPDWAGRQPDLIDLGKPIPVDESTEHVVELVGHLPILAADAGRQVRPARIGTELPHVCFALRSMLRNSLHGFHGAAARGCGVPRPQRSGESCTRWG
jgi:hypothetical protein